MGWWDERAAEHEGWVANVLDDGRAAAGSTSGGVVVSQTTLADLDAGQARPWPAGGGFDVVLPWERVARWQVRCECGWAGPDRPAYATSPRGWRDVPEDVEEQMRLAWQQHLAPVVALAELADLTEEVAALEQRRAQAVRDAREGGATWEQVGRAARMTRQSAHERWAAAPTRQP